MPTTTIEADPQNILASLRRWQLEQDNSGPFRVYRDQDGQIYHSVTHILKHTAPQAQKDALERWSKRAGSGLERELACDRGTIAHEHCEYVLKTAAKLARQSANKKGSWSILDDGLALCPFDVNRVVFTCGNVGGCHGLDRSVRVLHCVTLPGALCGFVLAME